MIQIRDLAELLGVAQAWIAAARESGFAGFLSAQDQFARDPTEEAPPARIEKLTGIYFWIAENGEGYVGQALDIRKRLKAHFKISPDLVAAAYLLCAPDTLDAVEKRQIMRLEGAFDLRNILLVSQSAQHRPLDNIVPLTAQRSFVTDGNQTGWHRGPRRRFPILVRRQRHRVARIAAHPDRMELGQTAVTFFVDACVPDPYATEHRFWSVTGFDKGEMIARINVGVQEVLTVHNCGSIRLLCPEKLTLFAGAPLYRSGAREHIVSFEKCADLFDAPKALLALRSHVISLMRHTTALNARSHCPIMLRPQLIAGAQNAA